jgi:hypothetical protein
MVWQDVTKALPDNDRAVLIFERDEVLPVWLGYFDEPNGWRYLGGSSCSPTHWAELPEGPAVPAVKLP